MKYQPSYRKIFKRQKGKTCNKINSSFLLKKLSFGSLGLIAKESGYLTSKQINCFYQTVNKILKKNGKFFLKIFPHTPITKKPLEVRMGKGKGSVNHWVAKIKVGTILCEIESSSKKLGLFSLSKGKFKLPLLAKIITKY